MIYDCAFFSADGLVVFREFLRGEFSDENIEFWIACKEYKSLKSEDDLRCKAQEIYEAFIAFQSQREVGSFPINVDIFVVGFNIQ